MGAKLTRGLTFIGYIPSSHLYTMPNQFLIHIDLVSTVIIAPIEFHAYVSLTIGVVPTVTIIAVVIVVTCTAFK